MASMASTVAGTVLTKVLTDLVASKLGQKKSSSNMKAQPAKARGPKGPSRTQKKQQSKKNEVVLQGSSKMFRSTEPAAVNTSLSNPTYIGVTGRVSHNDFGTGIRVEGRQLLVDITTDASTSALFGSNGTATIASVGSLNLSPDTLNGRLALQARNYSRYAFRRVSLHYIPRVATSDVGQFALGYSLDGAETTYATNSFASTTTLSPSMVCPFRKEMRMDIHYKGDLTWLTEADGATSASARQTIQGMIIGFPDASAIGALTHGWLWAEYVIDLYGQNADYGFTLSLKTDEEKKIACEAVRRHRALCRAEGDDDFDKLSVSASSRKTTR